MIDPDGWRFDENPEDSQYDAAGVGQWSTKSARKLGLENKNERSNENMAKEKEKPTYIITPEFRVSFPNLHAPRAPKTGGKARYSVSMVFRTAETPESKARGEKLVDLGKRNPQTPDQPSMKEAVMALLLKHLGPNWAEEIKKRKSDGSPLYQVPFKDGGAAEKKDMPGYGVGTTFVNAASDFKPGVLDRNKVEILDIQKEVYGGCYARAQVHVFWYSNQTTGVSFSLDNVQKVRDGEPLGGGPRASDAFDAIEPPSGAVPAGAGASTSSDPLAAL